MKKNKILTVFSAFVLMFLFAACESGYTEKDLLGTWKVEKATIENLDEIMAFYRGAETESLKDVSDEELKELIEQDFMVAEMVGDELLFEAENKLTIHGNTGTWKFSDDKKKIIAKNENTPEGSEFVFEIKKLNAKQFDYNLTIKFDVDIKLDISSSKK